VRIIDDGVVEPPISSYDPRACDANHKFMSSAHSLLPPDPDLLLAAVSIPHLNLPQLQSISPSVCLAGEQIKAPSVLRTRDTSRQCDAEVLNIERCAIAERV
jgi:hypothetical protein